MSFRNVPSWHVKIIFMEDTIQKNAEKGHVTFYFGDEANSLKTPEDRNRVPGYEYDACRSKLSKEEFARAGELLVRPLFDAFLERNDGWRVLKEGETYPRPGSKDPCVKLVLPTTTSRDCYIMFQWM